MVRSKQAREPEDKLARRQIILDAAQALYQEQHIDQVTIASVARRASLAKGTLYIYFPTKEAIFIELLTSHLSEWFDELELSLQLAEKPLYADRVTTLIVSQLVARPLLVRLLGVMHVVLEKNLTKEAMIEFKRALLDDTNAIAQSMSEQIDGLSEERAMIFLLQLHALVVGTGQMTQHTEAFEQALEEAPELRALKTEFDVLLAPMVSACLNALVMHTH